LHTQLPIGDQQHVRARIEQAHHQRSLPPQPRQPGEQPAHRLDQPNQLWMQNQARCQIDDLGAAQTMQPNSHARTGATHRKVHASPAARLGARDRRHGRIGESGAQQCAPQ